MSEEQKQIMNQVNEAKNIGNESRDRETETPLEAFRRSAGFQIMFVLHSGLEIGRAIDHLCASAQKLVAASREWQPIETAPKGRKLIVGYWNPLGNWRSVMGRYYLDGTLESEVDDSGFAPEGWYEETEAYEYLMPMDQEPARWMLLPTEPPCLSINNHSADGQASET